MAAHRFGVGECVEIRRTPYQGEVGQGPYTVVRQLPNDGPDREYRVKSIRGGQERVVLESALSAGIATAGDKLFREPVGKPAPRRA